MDAGVSRRARGFLSFGSFSLMSTIELQFPGMILVRAGVTCLDLQGRLTGTLDLPLAPEGEYQVQQMVEQLQGRPIGAVLSAPGLAALSTANPLARAFRLRPRVLEGLENIDFGLWHGRCADELQQTQPRLLKCLEETPDAVCPPQGEPLKDFRERIRQALAELPSKYSGRLVAVVVAGPVAAMIRSLHSGRNDFDEIGLGLWFDAVSQAGWIDLPAGKSSLSTETGSARPPVSAVTAARLMAAGGGSRGLNRSRFYR